MIRSQVNLIAVLMISCALTLGACAVDDVHDADTSSEADEVIVGINLSVRQWQTDLRAWQIFWSRCRPSVDVDGAFGPMTDSATRCFQRAEGITADGDVGPNTRDAMCFELLGMRRSDLFNDTHC